MPNYSDNVDGGTVTVAGSDLCTKVELMLSARNLADKDVFSKSDPICIVYQLNPSHNIVNTSRSGSLTHPEYVEVGRTETIKNSLNPQWNKKIYVNYYFEAKQPLRFDLYPSSKNIPNAVIPYDIDSASQALTQHDFLGRCECQLADIVAAPGGALTLPVRDISHQKGQLTIHGEEVDEGQRETVYFVCHGRGLDKKDFFGKSDPFLEFYRLLPDGKKQLVHRTEKIKKNLNPEWKPFEITVRHLCEANKDREFEIVCYDYDYDGGHDLIGICRTSVNALALKRQTSLPLINEKKRKKKGSKYKDSGVLHFLNVQVRREFTFLEFISAGMQIEFAVAIDFTASNGPVHTSSSLHYINSSYMNQYEMAISSVLEICEHYNRSKVFEAVGFGAKIPPHGTVSHLFPLNLMGFERSVQGVAGVLGAYKTALRSTTLYGPTNFSPTIDDYAYKCRNFPKDASKYQILLIVTDGIITDMEKTKASIIAASDLPLSIIIIGVGNEEFEKMDELDSDESLLTHNGRTAQRDIVQFVPFRLFMGAVPSAYNAGQISKPADQAYVQSLLAKEVLAEVPDQVTSYFKLKGIAPLQLHNQAQAYPQPYQGQGPGYPQSQQQPNMQMYPNAQPPYPLQHPSPAQTGQVGVEDINFRMQQNLSLNSSAPPQESYSMS